MNECLDYILFFYKNDQSINEKLKVTVTQMKHVASTYSMCMRKTDYTNTTKW